MLPTLDVEIEMFRFFEMTPDLVCIAHKDGYFKNFNQAVINKLGYTKEELLKNPISTFIHPDDKIRTAASRSELLNGKALINFENRYITKKGDIIWLHWTSIYFNEKELVFAIAKDVTKKKDLENQNEEKYLQFKKLVDHFKFSIEKDKQTLAEELHEELAQTAAVVKLNLDNMLQQVKGKGDVLEQSTEQALKATEQLLTSIRRISYSISPQMLDDVGFSETLKWLCQEFQNMSGVACTLTCKLDEKNISRSQQLELFRICQETLGFVINRAKASKVEITIMESKNNHELSVMVTGAGYEYDQLTQNLSLTSLRERIASLNGTLFIESSEQVTQLLFTMAR